MCGLAGFVAPVPVRTRGVVARLLAALAHRGPDDRGWLALTDRTTSGRDPEAVPEEALALLLHRRLSIIDLTETGWQPLSSSDGNRVIVFNGEIYNHVELRTELEKVGRTFRGTSDTEVLLAAWAEWGDRALPRLVGMFAFAILDLIRRELVLARDPFGIKPLYVARAYGGVAFASEPGALLELTGLPRRANAARALEFLVHGTTDHGHETLFAGIEQVPAAHWTSVPLDRPELSAYRRYWHVPPRQSATPSFDEAVFTVRERFLENVRLHLRSDVPLGSALSGGIDSSSIVMAMRRLAGPRHELHSFSYVADDPSLDEERWVDVVATAGDLRAHKVRVKPAELASDVDALVLAQGEPFGSTSVYAQSRVFRLVREHGIKVVLDGQGADETLAGYPFYSVARLAGAVARARLGEAARLVGAHAAGDRGAFIRHAARFLLPMAVERRLRRLVPPRRLPRWLDARWFRDRGAAIPPFAGGRGSDSLRGWLVDTITRSSLPQLLRYEDRNSMAVSVESRVPFLTTRLVEYLLSLPDELLIAPDGSTKHVFRTAMRGIVPDTILDRRDKIGFATPEPTWLDALSPWVERTLGAHALVPALSGREVRDEWELVRRRERPFDFRVWRWLSVIRWTELFQVTWE